MSTDVPFDPFTMDDVDPDRPGASGGGQLPEGGYRVIVTEVIVQNKRNSTEVKCEVVVAKDSNLVGKSHDEYLKWPKAEYTETGNRIAKEQLLAWCYAAKTTNADEIRARQEARQGFDPAWLEAMVGREVLIYVKHDQYFDQAGNERTSSKAEGRVWAIDNPKGKGIPGYAGPATPAAGPAGGQAAQQQSPPAAAAPQQQPASDPFAGLV